MSALLTGTREGTHQLYAASLLLFSGDSGSGGSPRALETTPFSLGVSYVRASISLPAWTTPGDLRPQNSRTEFQLSISGQTEPTRPRPCCLGPFTAPEGPPADGSVGAPEMIGTTSQSPEAGTLAPLRMRQPPCQEPPTEPRPPPPLEGGFCGNSTGSREKSAQMTELLRGFTLPEYKAESLRDGSLGRLFSSQHPCPPDTGKVFTAPRARTAVGIT